MLRPSLVEYSGSIWLSIIPLFKTLHILGRYHPIKMLVGDIVKIRVGLTCK